MGQIAEIPFEQENEQIKDKVTSYWTKRADSFAQTRHEEAHSYKAKLWETELLQKLHVAPEDLPHREFRILDVGCGAGFFELVLAPLGFQMTGIDLTPEMITKGRDLLKRHGAESAELLVMDAEHPDFPDGSFDAVITRNLTWTIPHPKEAYAAWHRLLKPGGILLNYDAEYAKGFHKYDQKENLAHKVVGDALIEECHDIYHMLAISALSRPDWDREVLKAVGFSAVETDLSAGDRLYGEKDQFYMPDRMFCIRAVK